MAHMSDAKQPQTLVAAVVQMSSQESLPENLAQMEALVARAARAGAKLVVLPENFAYFGHEAGKRAHAERLDRPGPIQSALARTARSEAVTLIAGGFPEATDDPARPFNASACFDPAGNRVAIYRKIHLFD